MTTSAAVIAGSVALVGGLRRRRGPCVEPVLAVTGVSCGGGSEAARSTVLTRCDGSGCHASSRGATAVAVRCGGYWRSYAAWWIRGGSARVGTLVDWATRASSDPGLLLPAICRPLSLGWLPWRSWSDLLAAGQLCQFWRGGGLSDRLLLHLS
jgi:hypothetical protein